MDSMKNVQFRKPAKLCTPDPKTKCKDSSANNTISLNTYIQFLTQNYHMDSEEYFYGDFVVKLQLCIPLWGKNKCHMGLEWQNDGWGNYCRFFFFFWWSSAAFSVLCFQLNEFTVNVPFITWPILLYSLYSVMLNTDWLHLIGSNLHDACSSLKVKHIQFSNLLNW